MEQVDERKNMWDVVDYGKRALHRRLVSIFRQDRVRLHFDVHLADIITSYLVNM
jgi:hypothetical protein